jgi:amidase
MNRRNFLQLAALSGGAQALAITSARGESPTPLPTTPTPARVKPFEWEEATVAGLQAAMKSGKESAASLTKKYLRRIEEVDPRLRAVLEVNPDAGAIARELDRERKAKGPRGPLHGIPVLIKDNIDTHDRMMTTAGSLALHGSIAPRDSGVAEIRMRWTAIHPVRAPVRRPRCRRIFAPWPSARRPTARSSRRRRCAASWESNRRSG